MKKAILAILAATLIMTTGTTSAFAAGCGRNRSSASRNCTTKVCTEKRYTDKNKDGICDNCGRGYTDKNKDGICDNYSSSKKSSGKGCGRGHCR